MTPVVVVEVTVVVLLALEVGLKVTVVCHRLHIWREVPTEPGVSHLLPPTRSLWEAEVEVEVPKTTTKISPTFTPDNLVAVSSCSVPTISWVLVSTDQMVVIVLTATSPLPTQRLPIVVPRLAKELEVVVLEELLPSSLPERFLDCYLSK